MINRTPPITPPMMGPLLREPGAWVMEGVDEGTTPTEQEEGEAKVVDEGDGRMIVVVETIIIGGGGGDDDDDGDARTEKLVVLVAL